MFQIIAEKAFMCQVIVRSGVAREMRGCGSRHSIGAANGRKLHFKLHVNIQIVSFIMCWRAIKTKHYSLHRVLIVGKVAYNSGCY